MTYVPPTLEATGSVSIAALKNRHPGSTCYVVGKGPSLANLRASDFASGPIITLNQAIVDVQALGIGNPTYAFQKDGCEPGPGIPRPCKGCGVRDGWIRAPLIDPRPGISVIFTQYLSSWCLLDRADRYVATDAELGYPDDPYTMSVLEAIPLAKHLGAAAVVMVAFDSLVNGDLGYRADYAGDAAAVMRTNLENVRPQVLAALDAFGPYSFLTPRPRRWPVETPALPAKRKVA